MIHAPAPGGGPMFRARAFRRQRDQPLSEERHGEEVAVKQTAIVAAVVMIGIALWGAPATAGSGPARVAVMPFDIQGKTDLDYLRDGIQQMLSSRLYWKDRVSVLANEAVNSAAAGVRGFQGESLALIVGAKLRADYVLLGSADFSGETARIRVGVVETTGEQAPLSFTGQAEGPDGVIAEVNRIATRINQTVFGRQPAVRVGEPPPESPKPVKSGSAGDAAADSPFVSARPAAPVGGVRKSRPLPFAIAGIDLGDTDGDGTTDIVALSDHAVEIYGWADGRLARTAEAAQSRRRRHIGVDVADIDGDGVPEIFVTALSRDRERVRSFVLEYDGAAYRPVVQDAPWCFRVVRPDAGAPWLLGQKQPADAPDIFSTPVHRMTAQNGAYVAGETVLEKGGAVVTGMTLSADSGMIFGFGHKGRIRALSSRGGVRWKSSERYGGGLHYFIRPDPDPTADTGDTDYFPMRLRRADADGDGRVEVITVANKDAAHRIFQRFRSFDNGRMAGLSWDGLRLAPIWTTQPLSGRISDFAVGDVDGDGDGEMVLSLVTKEGDAAFADAESAIIVYDAGPRETP